jgi:putative oxidoreductase
MNGRAGSEPKLLFPGLAGFYAAVSDLSYPLIRIVVGGCLIYHGWAKVQAGITPIAASMAKNGFVPGIAFGYAAIFLETVGAVCIMLGLFTRFFAAAIAIEMALITFVVQMPNGFGRMELPFMWGLVMFAIALRGGGPYSLDRKIGTEL